MRRTGGQRLAAAGILLMLAACGVSAIVDMNVDSQTDNQMTVTAPEVGKATVKAGASSKQSSEDMEAYIQTAISSSSSELKSKAASSPKSAKDATYEAPASSPTQMAPAPAMDSKSASAPSLGMSEEMRAEVLNIIQQALDNRLPAAAGAPSSVIHATPEDIQAATTPGSDAAESSLAEAIRKAPAGQIIYETPVPVEAAPAAAQEPASHDAAAAAPAAGKIQHAWWAGKQIKRISKSGADKKVKGEMPVGNVTSIQDLDDLNDAQLYQIFTTGEPDVPGETDPGSFTFCVGNPILNAFTNGSWPHGSWPGGNKSPINNVVERVWRGKVMYRDPETNVTNLWNLLWSNSTVAAIANVSRVDPGLSADKKPSAVINYGLSENVFFRTLRDEIRRVGSSIWLGRAWVTDPIGNWGPTHPRPIQGAIADALKGPLNNTVNAATEAIGLQGPGSTLENSGGPYPTPGEPVAILYFALDCTQNAVPKLYYTEIAETQALTTGLKGWNTPFYKLPALNSAPGPGSVENWEKEAPQMTSTATAEPFILYPFKPSDVGPIGYIKLPARFFEPVFGAWWLYDYKKQANITGADPKTKALQEHIEFPIREAAQNVAAPILNPIATGLGNLPNDLPSPFVVQRALHRPVRAP